MVQPLRDNPLLPTIMTDSPEQVPLHPIAPRLKNGSKIPHIGPDIDAYKAAHAVTVAEDSDEWWAKVCISTYPCGSGPNLNLPRLRVRLCTGIVPSKTSELADLEQET